MKTSLFRAAIFTPMARGRWGLPLLAWSTPGLAKSAVLRELCAGFGLPLVVLSPGEMGEGAFGVIPVPDRSGVIKYPPAEWVGEFKDPSGAWTGGVVFVDEATCTPPSIQPAILGLILDGRIGGTVLGPRVRRIAAANPPEYAANGYDLNPAQANRFGHVDWMAPTVAEHTTYMLRGTTGHDGNGHTEFSAESEEARVLAAWNGGAWARAVGLETSFLAARPDMKNRCPKAMDPQASRAWASDRSWENATRALASAQVHGLTEPETDEFVSAFIGAEVYAEWKAFIIAQDLPNAADLLDGKITFEHRASRMDRTAAVLNACIALVTPVGAPNRDDRAVTLWNTLRNLFEGGVSQDLALPIAHAMINAKLGATADSPKLRAAFSKLGQQPNFVNLLRLSGFGK